MEAVAPAQVDIQTELEADESVRFPATWDEYLDLAETSPHTVQFLYNEVIMSQASDIHEELVMVVGWLLKNAFQNQREFRVLGSNVKIVIPNHEGDVNADVSVVRGPSDYGLTPGGNPTNVRIKNPEIVVEVLSKSTRQFDQFEKLAYYKRIPSMQHVLFVDQYQPFVSVYSRTSVANEWLNLDYWTLDSAVRFGDHSINMNDIYQNMTFPA